MCLASVQYFQIWKRQNHSLQEVIKLLLINIWSCLRSTSKQTVEVMLPPVHATRHMCVELHVLVLMHCKFTWLVGGR